MRTEKTITRTVTNWKITALVCDTEKSTLFDKVVFIPELIPEKKRKDFITEKCLAKNEICVQIKNAELFEELYAMSETDFLKYAHKIDKR